jgi:peptidoglycan/xylan/chitin deacetylase (PgdA/CDA1 family)
VSAPEVVILGHHKIGPIPEGYWESWYYVSVEAFTAQLRLLRERGYAFLALRAFLDGLDKPASLPPKSVLVTFDDGYTSLLKYAVPVLKEFACPAVVFVPTGLVGGSNSFDHQVEPHEAIATWDELREFEKHGVAVQPHGVNHAALSDISRSEIEKEIADSKRAIEENLKRPAQLFSFPYGDNGKEPALTAALLKKHGYRAACLYGGKKVPFAAANRYKLTRIALGSDSDLAKELDARDAEA